MKGLIIKDLYAIREGLLIPVLSLVVMGVALSAVTSPWILIIIAASSFSMQVALTITADKASQWYKFSATLPVSRAQFVAGKYFLYALLGGAGILMGAIITVIATMIKGDFNSNSLLLNVCFAVVMILLPGSINIPCVFLLDEEKSIAGLILSYVISAGLFVGFQFLLGKVIDMEANTLLVHGFLAVFSLIVFLLSWIFAPKALGHIEL